MTCNGEEMGAIKGKDVLRREWGDVFRGGKGARRR